jgi:hypothetical protein
VLKNRETNEVLFVVNFALIPIDKKAEETVDEKKAEKDDAKDNEPDDDELD